MATQTINDTQAEPGQTEGKTTAPLQWRLTLLTGFITGVIWTLVIWFGGSTFQLLAGIAPVVGGIFLGRKVKERALAHGSLMALAALLTAIAMLTPLVIYSDLPAMAGVEAQGVIVQIGFLMLVSLLPFPIYGTLMATRTAKRNDEFRKQMDERGGQLRTPGRVVNLDDLQALPVDKFASWVGRLFTRNGFTMIDYKFDKDVVDLKMKRADPEEQWLIRCTVAEAVKPGVVQSLAQDVRESEFAKGVVVTSTVIQDGARKWAKGRRNIEMLDGETLIEIKD